jgi:hypothetical protein
LPRLRRLHDACLEPPHVLVDRPPINGVPVSAFVGNRTNRFRWCCRHLLCFLCRFAKLSRDARPVGSQPTFAAGQWAPYPPDYRAAFACSDFPYPHRHRAALQPSSPPGWERYGLTMFLWNDEDGLGALCSPVAVRAHDGGRGSLRTSLQCLLAPAWQHLGLVGSHDVYREFAFAHHAIYPGPAPRDARRCTVPSRFRCLPEGSGYVVRGLFDGALPCRLTS